jgi:hypothetical protein
MFCLIRVRFSSAKQITFLKHVTLAARCYVGCFFYTDSIDASMEAEFIHGTTSKMRQASGVSSPHPTKEKFISTLSASM